MSIDHTTIQIVPENIESALSSFILARDASNECVSRSLQLYKHCIKKLIAYLKTKEIFLMHEITTDILREFFLGLKEKHSEGGVHHIYRPIKAFFIWYWDEFELETRNPISKVKMKPPKMKPKPGIPLHDLEMMVEVCKTELKQRDKAILLCLLDSAARATEFCEIRIGDVNLITGHVQLNVTKGDKIRSVRFGSRALRMLRRYLKTRGFITSGSPLFASDTGEKLDRFSLRLMVDRRADNAGVHRPGLHDFRRRCAYEMLKKKVPTKMVSEYLGHANVTVTERYLAIVNDDVLDAHKNSAPADYL